MIPVQRAALRLHVEAIERFDRSREEERKRLAAPHERRNAELWERSHTAVGPPDSSGVFTSRGFTTDEHREVLAYHDAVEAGLAAFDLANKPNVEPFDTPAKIAAWIAEQEFGWSADRWRMLDSYGQTPPDQARREHDEAKARDAYREARRRAFRFLKFDPGLVDRLSERADPIIGLQDITAWAEDLTAGGAADDGKEAARHAFRTALRRLIGAIHDAPAGREFGDWTDPLTAQIARAASELGYPPPIQHQGYVDMVREAGDGADGDVSSTFVRYTAPESNASMTLHLQGYRRERGRWMAFGGGGLDADWRLEIVRVLRMWLRHTEDSTPDGPTTRARNHLNVGPHDGEPTGADPSKASPSLDVPPLARPPAGSSRRPNAAVDRRDSVPGGRMTPYELAVAEWVLKLSSRWVRPTSDSLSHKDEQAVTRLVRAGLVEARLPVTLTPQGAAPISVVWRVTGDYGRILGEQVKHLLASRGHAGAGCGIVAGDFEGLRLTSEGELAQCDFRGPVDKHLFDLAAGGPDGSGGVVAKGVARLDGDLPPATSVVVGSPERGAVEPAGSSGEPPDAAAAYHKALRALHGTGCHMESHPSTYAGKDEEALRDYLLGVLSTHFQSATAETFNKTGKTDMLVRHNGDRVLLAECKVWGGPKLLHATIDQALGYATWRDARVAVLLFVPNREIAPVIKQVEAISETHPCCVAAGEKMADGWYDFEFHLPGDPAHRVRVAVLCFHFPPPKAQHQ